MQEILEDGGTFVVEALEAWFDSCLGKFCIVAFAQTCVSATYNATLVAKSLFSSPRRDRIPARARPWSDATLPVFYSGTSLLGQFFFLRCTRSIGRGAKIMKPCVGLGRCCSSN